MTDAQRTDGYSVLSIAAHWIAAIIVIVLFFTHEGGRDSLSAFVHISAGSVLGLFLLWRVWHRLRRGVADKPEQPFIFNLASRLVIWGFLAAIVVVVLTGYLLPWSLGRPVDVLGLVSIPSPLGSHRWLHEAAEEVHDLAGHLFLPLLALHLLGAAKHAFLDRDGVTMRMVRAVAGGR